MSTPLIEASVQFLNQQLTEQDNGPSGHLRLMHDEGDEIHHIHDIKHTSSADTEKAVDHARNAVAHQMHKMYPKHYTSPAHARERYEDSLEHTTNHSDPLEHDDRTNYSNAKHVHHKTTADYAKHEAKSAHRWIKQLDRDADED